MTKLISITNGLGELAEKTPEQIIEYIARVSNPSNQTKDLPVGRLLKYCINHKHWSIFEQVTITFEITTSLAVATQILRHRSFVFQQYSNRYSKAIGFEGIDLRLQDTQNKQNSYPINWNSLSIDKQQQLSKLINRINDLQDATTELYNDLLNFGIAKETARFILPQNTSTRMYMTGNLRNWIHYLEVRTGVETQLEHRLVALEIKQLLKNIFPNVFEALEDK
jgi:thymidylate synthase (FAD)